MARRTEVRLPTIMMETKNIAPVNASGRYIILDALRGFALFGICLANYPEFSLYTFQPASVVADMPTAGIDRIIRFLQYVFIDGKFYTLFSLLFGIGFSIIISNAGRRGTDGYRIFYRRMAVLLLIGFLHLMLIWSGDILLLYALLGMLLPLFRNCSGRTVCVTAAVLLLLPVAVDAVAGVAGIELAAPAVDMQWRYCGLYGITGENFGVWLRDADNYGQVLRFLVQGAWERMSEFIDGNRYFKVMGLFLVGFQIGRNRLYADLDSHVSLLRKTAVLGFAAGLPLSLLYAWSAVNGHPAGRVCHTLFYTLSVYPMGMAYAAGLSLCYLRHRDGGLWKFLAAPGRMALSNYIGQSLAGMFLFYGIGLGLGAGTGLVWTELIAAAVFLFQAGFSALWLSFFRYGPLEWGWRMLTYMKWLPPVRSAD